MIKNKYLQKLTISTFVSKGILLIGIVVFSNSYGQDDCATTLTKAQKLYNEGVIEQIPQMLAPCIKDGFTSEERVQAQKLMILTALFNNNVIDAENEMLRFLQKNPEYQIASNDPAEFINLYQKYITAPNSYIGAVIGLVFPQIQVIKQYGVFNQNSIKGVYSSPTPGFSGGITYGHFINTNVDAYLEVNYSQYGIQYLIENEFDNITLKSIENYKQMGVPLSATYSYRKFKNIVPYARLGFVPTYTFAVTQLLERSYIDASLKPITGTENDITNIRNLFVVNGLVGGGLKFQVPRGVVSIEARYNLGTFNVVKAKQFENPDNLFYYYYSDNDYRISNLQLSLGFSYVLYKPRKK